MIWRMPNAARTIARQTSHYKTTQDAVKRLFDSVIEGVIMVSCTVRAAALCTAVCAQLALAQPKLSWEVSNRFPVMNQGEFKKIENLWSDGGHTSMVSFINSRLEGKRSGVLPNTEFVLTDPVLSKVETDSAFKGGEPARVVAKLDGAKGPCAWSSSLPIAPDGNACELKLLAPYGVKHSLEVTSAGQTFRTDVFVHDIVIVSMGDSYSSGEGSPDRPALYRAVQTPEWNDWFARGEKGPIELPVWWYSPCHRSMLSWPVLSALRVALTSTNSTVRLVDVSCSGAEFLDGIFYSQSRGVIRADSAAKQFSRDGLPPYAQNTGGQTYFKRSQVNEVRDILCEPRTPAQVSMAAEGLPSGIQASWRPCVSPRWRPDALVITGGGNDAKFGPAVMGAMVPNKTVRPNPLSITALAVVRSKIGSITMTELAKGAKALEPAYKDFLTAAANGALVTTDKTILMRYPNPIGGRDSVTGLPLNCVSNGQPDRIQTSFMAFGPTARALASGVPLSRKINWVVELSLDEVNDFVGGAYPAVLAMQSNVPKGLTSVDWEEANPQLFANRYLCSPVAGGIELESTFFCNNNECKDRFTRKPNLADIRLEAPGRLFVNSTNDAILGQRTWRGGPTGDDLLIAVGGTMHPTTEAHALGADSMYVRLCGVLRKGKNPEACSDL